MSIGKYISSIINIANTYSRATRPDNVGQMSELIKEFRKTSQTHSLLEWEKFYNGEDKIIEASKKNWSMIEKIKENLNCLTEDDVYHWTKDLIIHKTYSGLEIQLEVLKLSANGKIYRLSNPEEEKRGIDGFIEDEPVSIKSNTYTKTIQSKIENIPYRIIYYTEGKKGIIIK